MRRGIKANKKRKADEAKEEAFLKRDEERANKLFFILLREQEKQAGKKWCVFTDFTHTTALKCDKSTRELKNYVKPSSHLDVVSLNVTHNDYNSSHNLCTQKKFYVAIFLLIDHMPHIVCR